MVDHFSGDIHKRIDNRAKAMIVTRSRLHAVRYKLAVDAHLAEKGHPWKCLVAFSGKVSDGGREYTEAGDELRRRGPPDRRGADGGGVRQARVPVPRRGE